MRRAWILVGGGIIITAIGVYGLLLVYPFWLPQFRYEEGATLKVNSPPEVVASAENHLYIEKIGVSLPIAKGNDETALDNGVWHRKPQNGDPVNGGNFVLSAHRFSLGWTPEGTVKKSPFYNIDKLVVGDELVVDYDGKRFTYAVARAYSVQPSDVQIEDRSSEPKLTLYSCTLGGSYDGRDVIEAVPR